MAWSHSTQPIDACARYGEDERDCRSSGSRVNTICQVYWRGVLCFNGHVDVAVVNDEVRCVPHCTQAVARDGVLSVSCKRRPCGAVSICDTVWECVPGVAGRGRF